MPQAPIPQRRSVRRGLRRADASYEGVPAHLLRPLQQWARVYLGHEVSRQIDDSRQRANVIRLAILCRVHVDSPRYYHQALIDLADDEYGAADDFFDVVDLHLQMFGAGSEVLKDLLRDGGSALTVGGSPPQLLDRVSEEQQEQFDEAVAPVDAASDLLSRAWANVHARHPDPTGAWADAVKAVEVLLAPIVALKDNRPQLGKMIGYIAQAPHKWTTTLQQDKVATLDVFVDALRVLYPNPGRHDDQEATQEEAEAAVSLAVLIVSWLRSGAFRQAGSPASEASP